VSGSVTNNRVFTAGTGAISINGSLTNSGAFAVYDLNTNATSINGNLNNVASATINGSSGTISVGGSWTNSATFSAGTGSVIFNGTGTQSFTGGTTFYNLERVNGGSIIMNDQITVAGDLTLASGNILTGSNLLSLLKTSGQPVSGYGTGSFVDGRLAIAYPNTAGTSRVFPIGKGGVYRPVAIQQTAASTSPVIAVEMINTPPIGTYPTAVGVLSEARYYSIDQLSGTMSSPTIELNFNTNGSADENVLFPGNVHIMRATVSTGPWTDENGSGVFSPAAPAGYATSGITSIDNTTFFTLGYQNAPLPVVLSAFSGVLHNSTVFLDWTTRTEKNNLYFAIERSGPELQFDSIGFVNGAGTSHQRLDYQFSDSHPLPGFSYYRLRQTDFDGTFSYSKVVFIDNSGMDSFIDVYPNPGSLHDPVHIDVYFPGAPSAYLDVTDVAGKTIYKGSFDLNDDAVHIQDLPFQDQLVSGVYVLRFVINHFVIIRKLVVH
jgi:hypothetical protein